MKPRKNQPSKKRLFPNSLKLSFCLLGFLAPSVLFAFGEGAVVPSGAQAGARVGRFALPSFLISSAVTATYVKTPFVLPFALEVSVGGTWKSLYLGGGVDYWLSPDKDGNKMTSVGLFGEAGILLGYQRMFWLATVAAYYPAILSMRTSAGDHVSAGIPVSFRARLVAGLRLYPHVALLLGCGYRLQNVGLLSAPDGTAYDTGDLKLSGIFFTAGLSLTL